MICYRARSFQIFGLPGRPRKEFPVLTSELRTDENRILNLILWLNETYPGNRNRLQRIEAPNDVLIVEE